MWTYVQLYSEDSLLLLLCFFFLLTVVSKFDCNCCNLSQTTETNIKTEQNIVKNPKRPEAYFAIKSTEIANP